MKQVRSGRRSATINGRRVSEMDEEQAKQNLRELARDYERIKRERDNWRKKAKKFLGI